MRLAAAAGIAAGSNNLAGDNCLVAAFETEVDSGCSTSARHIRMRTGLDLDTLVQTLVSHIGALPLREQVQEASSGEQPQAQAQPGGTSAAMGSSALDLIPEGKSLGWEMMLHALPLETAVLCL